MELSDGDVERFWSHVDQRGADHCWERTAPRYRGYTRFRVNGRTEIAHRIAWTLANGPIPEGVCVLHRCDNRACVRPDHLFLGDRGDNARDRHAKGRSENVFEHGERHPMAKLTATEVLQIRALLARGARQPAVAATFGVTQSLVSLIASGKRWAHIH